MAVHVRSILAYKGNQVAAIETEATGSNALQEFGLHNIGALIPPKEGDYVKGDARILPNRGWQEALRTGKSALRREPHTAHTIGEGIHPSGRIDVTGRVSDSRYGRAIELWNTIGLSS
ncbi:MAG: hypothetical protein GY926_17815 [bacterium]|nr:hypothetical protein [bacterium]